MYFWAAFLLYQVNVRIEGRFGQAGGGKPIKRIHVADIRILNIRKVL